MPKIRIRPLAIDDLSEIWSYIAEDSPNRADRFIDSIDSIEVTQGMLKYFYCSIVVLAFLYYHIVIYPKL
ncbi:type II toxin-antitoxin system RelE/ParE family toxin [Chlorobaculum sp. 24CR]|uniref:type II toxin-antitoxin system RelE/ParE family toxin n=1 Tax=Chlorobaculum sp. 24CR TaxID=2508878 RepID=UPI00100A93E4|nr:type II toxin-antitoxin system RelE/ParE family toxin [Chlorobaculum sp. 24CR]RXK80522.1 type II toxin-antitoxin system RelE/ParE family toxin [Chlorobaculum sp. 24CR]